MLTYQGKYKIVNFKIIIISNTYQEEKLFCINFNRNEPKSKKSSKWKSEQRNSRIRKSRSWKPKVGSQGVGSQGVGSQGNGSQNGNIRPVVRGTRGLGDAINVMKNIYKDICQKRRKRKRNILKVCNKQKKKGGGGGKIY